MEELSGCSVEEMINLTTLKEGDLLQPPKVAQLTEILRKLQKGQATIKNEYEELKSAKEALLKELESLHTKAYELEGLVKDKRELITKLQLQCEDSEQECCRQLKKNKESKDLLEQRRCEIQEVRLKHRKLRMKFENQLQQLTEQFKQLHSVFTPERLPYELELAENTKDQLLSTEQLKLSQLHQVNEELEEMKKQK
ncbi:synaptonemal complex central element protein 1 isoform X1 [Nothobranchius furzeri]|uniref:Synaptonemal complex central element protein 1-like n=3 Tax=Nothobranchius furzeri TaxID=105023 RepID=A0A8C6MI59_NOTFU|nr:synaptonemal complex central element protein 1 isoform X1 [Nothobranchius furzeri]KAF7211172.1 transcript variant X1 [Nothobranchius furzeri]